MAKCKCTRSSSTLVLVILVPHQVRILVGDPVPVADLLRTADAEQWPDAQLYRSITARIADSLASLKVGGVLHSALGASVCSGTLGRRIAHAAFHFAVCI